MGVTWVDSCKKKPRKWRSPVHASNPPTSWNASRASWSGSRSHADYAFAIHDPVSGTAACSRGTTTSVVRLLSWRRDDLDTTLW